MSRPKKAYDFLGLVYVFPCLVVYLTCPPVLRDIYRTPVARYSLFVLTVPLNTRHPNQTGPVVYTEVVINFTRGAQHFALHPAGTALPSR